jgi:hypothetical protein
VSSDPEDFRPLTPNDFLNRSPTAYPPAGNFDDANPREHYRYLQRTLNLFWDIWKSVYLQSLSARKKWKVQRSNFAVGDIVLEINKSLGRGKWNIGHITQVYPGSDGLVRAVDVQFSNRDLPERCDGIMSARIKLVRSGLGGGYSRENSFTLNSCDLATEPFLFPFFFFLSIFFSRHFIVC